MYAARIYRSGSVSLSLYEVRLGSLFTLFLELRKVVRLCYLTSDILVSSLFDSLPFWGRLR